MPHMIFHCFFTEDISVHFSSSIHLKFCVLYVALGHGFMKFANKSILHTSYTLYYSEKSFFYCSVIKMLSYNEDSFVDPNVKIITHTYELAYFFLF